MLINEQKLATSLASKGIRYTGLRATRSKLIVLVVIAACMTTASGQNAVYNVPVHPVIAAVKILALGNSVNVYTSREEIYLATVSTRRDNYQLAKLIDAYSSDGNPILRSFLIQHRQLRMALVRSPSCDSTARGFFLDAGDENIFDVSARSELLNNGADLIPCYTVIHAATRLSK